MSDPVQRPGEVVAGRAADGSRLMPAARTFGQFVAMLESGQLDVDLATELRKLAVEMADAAMSNGGKSKGQFQVTFDFSLEGPTFFVSTKHKTKLPEEKRPRSITWMTEDGSFTPHAPNQGQLFGVRDVSGDASVRNV